MALPGKNKTKATRNYIFNISFFVPFLFLLFTGIIVLHYHSGYDYQLDSLGLNGNQWLKIHQLTALIVIPLIVIHLLMHIHWLKQLVGFKLKGKNSGLNLTLFIVFLMAALSALLAWFVFQDTKTAEVLREVHAKSGLLLIIFFGIHLSNYFKWLLTMSKKHFGKRKKSGN